MNIRSEVTKRDKWICRRIILNHYSLSCSFGRDEHLVLSHLTEANERRTVNVQFAETAMALGHDQTRRTRISQNTSSPGLYRQLLCTEALFPGDRAIDDPSIDVPFAR